MDREIPKEVRRKERNKKLIRYGIGAAVVVVVISVPVNLRNFYPSASGGAMLKSGWLGYAFSEAAGDFATMVKLTRMLSIIPTVLIFSVINVREKGRMNVVVEGERVNVLTLFPWFILGFLGLALFNSVGLIPAAASAFLISHAEKGP